MSRRERIPCSFCRVSLEIPTQANGWAACTKARCQGKLKTCVDQEIWKPGTVRTEGNLRGPARIKDPYPPIRCSACQGPLFGAAQARGICDSCRDGKTPPGSGAAAMGLEVASDHEADRIVSDRVRKTRRGPRPIPELAVTRRGPPPIARATDPETSHAGAAHAEKSRGTQCAELLDIIKLNPGLIGPRIADLYGMERHAAQKRISDLERQGLIAYNGKAVNEDSGVECSRVWAVGVDVPE